MRLVYYVERKRYPMTINHTQIISSVIFCHYIIITTDCLSSLENIFADVLLRRTKAKTMTNIYFPLGNADDDYRLPLKVKISGKRSSSVWYIIPQNIIVSTQLSC